MRFTSFVHPVIGSDGRVSWKVDSPFTSHLAVLKFWVSNVAGWRKLILLLDLSVVDIELVEISDSELISVDFKTFEQARVLVSLNNEGGGSVDRLLLVLP